MRLSGYAVLSVLSLAVYAISTISLAGPYVYFVVLHLGENSTDEDSGPRISVEPDTSRNCQSEAGEGGGRNLWINNFITSL